MQTLTAGSFLNLENAENVEALKFTAQRSPRYDCCRRRKLTTSALENLANDLWQKAQYVARETERRKLREIFARNFAERFRELKPEVPSAEIKTVEVQQNISAVENNDTIAQLSTAPMESVSTSLSAGRNYNRSTREKRRILGLRQSGRAFCRIVRNGN